MNSDPSATAPATRRRGADPRLPVRAGRLLRVRAVWVIPLAVASVVVAIMTGLYIASVVNPLTHLRGLPVAVVNEAMACGLPVVTTDAPGLVEIVVGAAKPVGLLVPREEPAALANALRRLLMDPGLSVAWGKNARAHVGERFSLEAVGQRLAECLGTAMSVDSGRRIR